MREQPIQKSNSILLGAIGNLLKAGGTLTLQEQLGALGLLAAQQELMQGQRLWDAHHRKFKYTPQTEEDVAPEGAIYSKSAVFLRREAIDTKKYDGAAIRAAEARNGCGKRKPLDNQPRTRMMMPWHSAHSGDAPRVIAYTLVRKPDGGVERFDNVRIFRGGNGRKLRRDIRLETSLTDGQWIVLVRALTARVLS